MAVTSSNVVTEVRVDKYYTDGSTVALPAGIELQHIREQELHSPLAHADYERVEQDASIPVDDVVSIVEQKDGGSLTAVIIELERAAMSENARRFPMASVMNVVEK